MLFQDTQPPFGPTPNELFVRYFHDVTNKTWGNISPLYRLDAFDWTILIAYFTILKVAREEFIRRVTKGRLRVLEKHGGYF